MKWRTKSSSWQPDSLRSNHTSTRPSSTSRRAVASSSRPSSSNGPSERSSRLVSGSGRLSTSQRLKPGSEPSRLGTPSRPPTANKGVLDEAVRSFEFLSLGRDKTRKWPSYLVRGWELTCYLQTNLFSVVIDGSFSSYLWHGNSASCSETKLRQGFCQVLWSFLIFGGAKHAVFMLSWVAICTGSSNLDSSCLF